MFIAEIGFLFLSLVLLMFIGFGLKFGAGKDLELKKMVNRILVGVVCWMALLLMVSSLGFTSNFNYFPLNLMLVLAVPLITLIFLSRSKNFLKIIFVIPQQWLLNLQSFRIGVEILLWWLFANNLLSIHLTFEGANWDILAGVFGLLFGLLVNRLGSNVKHVILGYNIAGLLLLANIVIMAILTFPTPFQIYKEGPGNLIFTKLPHVLLPGFLVPVAYYLHVFSIKKLRNNV